MICIVINECLSRGMTNRSPAECQGASEEGNDFARMLKNVNGEGRYYSLSRKKCRRK